ncbi:4Fe-4S dicluster domain-containing protein [Lacrimispora sp.]|uniref:4Fe-4S dicluster domain-containing protein n=1 Tax=Lacrimispora sp. TaxID=2719234 RepID=UPI002FDA292B
MLNELISKLHHQGADIVKVIDISMLSENERRGYDTALLIGIALSQEYIYRLAIENRIDHSEFSKTEKQSDQLAEWTADFIIAKGYKALAQSENILLQRGNYDESIKTTPLPHKKIALLAGLGWIGKNNLLVTEQYGSALSICTVLTNLPLPTENKSILMPKCGKCTICKDICPVKVIHGKTWGLNVCRDEIVDVYHCKTCLKCLFNCPWTLNYIKTRTF